jgi:hypothetical protein
VKIKMSAEGFTCEEEKLSKSIESFSRLVEVKNETEIHQIHGMPKLKLTGKIESKNEINITISSGFARTCAWIGNHVIVGLLEMKQLSLYDVRANIKFRPN